MSDILAVMSVALKATFWPCQQDFGWMEVLFRPEALSL
jgi:hypothetical protein